MWQMFISMGYQVLNSKEADVRCDNRGQREKRQHLELFGSGIITMKARLCWYGHIMQMDEGNKVKQMMKMKVRGTQTKEDQ